MIRPRQQRWLQWVFALTIAVAALILLLPIDGKVIITTNTIPAAEAWPRFNVERSTEHEGEQYWVSVHDIRPWSHVMLVSAAGSLTRDEAWAAGTGPWRWRWLVRDGAMLAQPLVFYHSCATGCRERGRADFAVVEPLTEPAVETQYLATKLGLVFPSPKRDWHNRAGWAVELTYAVHQEDKDFSIDGLAARVAGHVAQGLRVIVRVSYARGQSLPPASDEVALRDYLEYSKRLARDDRLRDVFAYAVGNGLNNPDESQLSQGQPLTPSWYARIFNGYSLPAVRRDNVVEVMRAERPEVRLLVGSVTPWITATDGELPGPIDRPWLNFFATTLTYLAASAEAKSLAGVPGVAPDGFALHAPGPIDIAPETNPTGEGRAHTGFRVYKDWLTTINVQPAFRGLPAYITATNTYVPGSAELPAQNYTPGWLTAALNEIRTNPQVHAFCWFVDEPLGELWTAFSLQQPVGRMHDAAAEFEQLLQQP